MNYFKRWQMTRYYQAAQRDALLANFKADSTQTELNIPYQRFWGGIRFEKWKKRSVDLLDGHKLIILTNQNINHDTILLLETNGGKVKEILGQGELKPQALTSRVIHDLSYRKKYNQRLIKSRIESRLDHPKQNILKAAQLGVSRLWPIERLVGARVVDLKATFDEIINTLNEYQNLREGDRSGIVWAEWEDLQGHHDAIVRDDQKAALSMIKEFEARCDDVAWLETDGYQKLASWIKDRTIGTLRQAQAMNQYVTHKRGTGAYFRGDLNSTIEDAVRAVRTYQTDLHNPINNDHQLVYEDNKPVTADSSFHTNGSREELDDLLLAISTVAGDNSSIEKKRGKVKITSATKWLHWRSFMDSNPYDYSLFHSPKHFFGKIWNLILSPFNLLETIVSGDNAGKVASLYYVPPENKEVEGKTDYYALSHRVKQKTALSTKIGLIIHNTISHFFWEGLAKGLYDGLVQISSLPKDLLSDFYNQDVHKEKLFQELDTELKTLNAELDKIKAPFEVKQEKPITQPYYAQPSISLSPYHSHGVWNGIEDGFEGFVDLFGHHMFAKHPFTAVVSSMAASTSFLAFFATKAAVSIMGQGYVDFLLSQGYIWAKDVFSASLAGSFTHFKLAGAIIEGIENGPDSWLSRFGSKMVNDPAEVAAYGTLAWLIGHAVVYQIEVPGISETFRSHIGHPAAFSELFGGFKIGIGGYHLLASPQKDIEAWHGDLVEYSVNLYRQMREKNNQAVNDEDINAVRLRLQAMVSLQEIKQFQENANAHFMKMSDDEKVNLALLMKLAANRHHLHHLDPVLKAKIAHALPQMVSNKDDAAAIEKFLDPEKHTSKSTLRSFLGRILGYIPVIVRCAISPLSGIIAWSFNSFKRPWQELGTMLLDDMTSTLFALTRFTNKVMETLFNRIPRTFADIVVNGIFARVVTFCSSRLGFGLTKGSYETSAAWDKAQEHLHDNTTGAVMNKFIRANTTPHPEVGFQNAVKQKIHTSFFSAKIEVDKKLPPLDSVVDLTHENALDGVKLS